MRNFESNAELCMSDCNVEASDLCTVESLLLRCPSRRSPSHYGSQQSSNEKVTLRKRKDGHHCVLEFTNSYQMQS